MSLPTCTRCSNVMGVFASFCNQCGTELPRIRPLETPPETFYFCDSDGHRLQVHFAQAKFCAGCGQNIAPLPN